jgi:putative membrane protein
LLGGFIFLVLWLVNKLTTSGDSTNKQTPIGILKERYAKGELTKEQFAQIKKDLD